MSELDDEMFHRGVIEKSEETIYICDNSPTGLSCIQVVIVNADVTAPDIVVMGVI